MMPQEIFKYGSFVAAATPADKTVNIGWVPDYVKIINQTTTAGNVVGAEWIRGMGDDAAMVKTIIVDNGTTGNKNMAFAASNGITPTSSKAVQTTDPITIAKTEGFIVAAELQVASITCFYVAARAA